MFDLLVEDLLSEHHLLRIGRAAESVENIGHHGPVWASLIAVVDGFGQNNPNLGKCQFFRPLVQWLVVHEYPVPVENQTLRRLHCRCEIRFRDQGFASRTTREIAGTLPRDGYNSIFPVP